METKENEFDSERREMMEQSSLKFADYQQQIEELQQNLSGNGNERSSINDHLHKVELELQNAIDNLASTTTKYETLIEERDAIVQQATHDAQERLCIFIYYNVFFI